MTAYLPIPPADRRRGLAAVAECRRIVAAHRPTTTNPKES